MHTIYSIHILLNLSYMFWCVSLWVLIIVFIIVLHYWCKCIASSFCSVYCEWMLLCNVGNVDWAWHVQCHICDRMDWKEEKRIKNTPSSERTSYYLKREEGIPTRCNNIDDLLSIPYVDYWLISWHVSRIFMPIIRRKDHMLLHMGYFAVSVGCGWLQFCGATL